MFRRMSVRNFTTEPVTDQELSTVLWAAYGYRGDHNRTVSGITAQLSTVIYVLRQDAVYRYDPLNHSLIFFKNGDFRSQIAQYEAPVQLGIVWNRTMNSDENYSGAEIGQIVQNIQFMANALDLGTVVTADRPSPLDNLSLPVQEHGRIVLPLGHPLIPYTFVYRPFWVSLLPRIKASEMNLSTALNKRAEATSFSGMLSRQELSQILWASYGFSYLIDKTNAENNPINRHRTVPSAHGYYPLKMYAVTSQDVFLYIPGMMKVDKYGLPIITLLLKIRSGDHREELAGASQLFIDDAPVNLVSVLDIKKTNKWDDLSGENTRWLWYLEAGASAHNVQLEAAAWGFSVNVVPIHDPGAVRSILRLSDDYLPLFVVPLGK